MLKNLKKIIFQKLFLVYFLAWAFLITIPTYVFLDVELIKWNIWVWFIYAEVSLTAISAILFGLFLASIMYKVKFFSPKHWSEWVAGWLFVTIVSGCPSCSITLASYIGLAGIISTLPYHGLELKVLWLLLIAYALYNQLKYLETCKIKTKSKSKKIKKIKKIIEH